MAGDLFKSLNEKQKEAVAYADGPSVILAGAGSGKTRVLVHKVLNLIVTHDIPPFSIAMITFTNKAASEMRERIEKSLPEFGHPSASLGYVGTFHSLGARILRIEAEYAGLSKNFTIYDEGDSLQVVKTILKEENVKRFTPSYYLNRISNAKCELITPQKYEEVFADSNAETVAQVYSHYEKHLRENQAVDFDDLLVKTITLLATTPEILKKYQRKFRYILVDEFQDTNGAQYEMTKLLAASHKNVTIVGDFSQSIYSWRGADIRNLERFKEDFPETKIFHLEKNYRSSQNILDYAFNVISKNKTHPILHLYSENEKGEEVVLYEAENEEEEAFFVIREMESARREDKDASFALLYRTNAQSRVIEEALLHFGIPYVLIGGTRFYERREVKDVLSYLRLLVNPVDTVASERIKKLGKRRWEQFRELYQKTTNVENISTENLIDRVFAATGYLDMYDAESEEDYQRLENIKELKSVALQFPKLTEFLEQVALVESEYFEGEKKKDGVAQVKLMTLHQAKGLEFDVVFIMGVEDGLLPHSRSLMDYFQLEEERRLFYVGITRARRKLYITSARRRFIFGQRSYALKSRFISEDTNYFQ